MARTYPLTVPYNQCLGGGADPLSFTSLRLEDLRNGQSQYLSTMKQLVDGRSAQDGRPLLALRTPGSYR